MLRENIWPAFGNNNKFSWPDKLREKGLTLTWQKMRRGDKKDEEDSGSSHAYTNLEKTILYLLNQGENLGKTEATECFFAITKLFQSKDPVLRRMVYLALKELSSLAEDVIIVTSSLTKDMTGKEDNYRPSAIRALCVITDATMLQAIERYMKQAIVDRIPAISSAALVSSLHISNDLIKRWVNEAAEACNSDSIMVQYHALGVLYHIRKTDRLAVTKMVSKLTRSSMKSPYATCLLIRIACKLIEDVDADPSSNEDVTPYFDFVESCIRHKNDMVIYEAAHAIANLKRAATKDISSCYYPVRTLNQVSMAHPGFVTACNLDLEHLITDSNRSIATLAITTLLKTGAESSVDRLMKQIASFVSEISDEFKIVVVHAIKSLCLKFPRKHTSLLNFLSGMLREEGGLDYKTSIADTIITIIEENPEARENGLAHLCEFIEDCDYTALAVRILHLLAAEGPSTSNPARYIRYIYNRVILENEIVRAAAVSALARFGALYDEVRDRATYFKAILEQRQQNLNSQFILNGLQVSLSSLEKSLHNYTLSSCDQAFDIKTVPVAPVVEEKKSTGTEGSLLSKPKDQSKPTQTRHDMFVEKLSTVSEIGHIVLQFDCVNTVEDQLLEDVTVDLQLPEGFNKVSMIPAPKLECNSGGVIYVVLETPQEILETVGSLSCTLLFKVKDCDPSTGEPENDVGYDDEYELEEFRISVGDYIQRLTKTNFASAWDELGPTNELEETFALNSMKTLEEASKSIINVLGLQPCERSDKVPEGKSSHTLLLAGIYRDGVEVLVRVKLALVDGVTMQLTVRAENEDVPELITCSI
ncbi:COPG [Lepeophtheirus salmonis]|uniref:Coatomer subunit gamma n=1 Tax=Lepeophtheirus salmonis TaxID=72036 RepID=A0A7R8D3B4_LEPSM|nr:COPG [Lepeophtheirus salmonis]CAF2981857.1 COPG [Lepeophtheirus salmonis]